MLELHDDQLHFHFPEITNALHSLVEQHVQAHLPVILEEDRWQALGKLFKGRWRAHAKNAEFCARAGRELAQLGNSDLERAFRRRAFQAANLSQEAPSADIDEAGPARVGIEFQRTLRIPDDGKDYPLPAGLGRFALRQVDDYSAQVPDRWRAHGGVFLPMYQAEAMWLNFDCDEYPFAVKIAAGKINAVTGDVWGRALHQDPAQDYLILPEQPWMDGFAVAKGIIRQFVAMPLGGGHSVEEQLTGAAEYGGLQVQVYPLRAEVFFQESIASQLPDSLIDVLPDLIAEPDDFAGDAALHAAAAMPVHSLYAAAPCATVPDMGLGAGGRMKQEIYDDERPPSDWEQNLTSRCFVHLCNSVVWREITGSLPPQPPLTATEYAKRRIPWFDYYTEDSSVLPGSERLAGVKSVGEFGKMKGEATLPGEGPIKPTKVIPVGPDSRPGQVREWSGD